MPVNHNECSHCKLSPPLVIMAKGNKRLCRDCYNLQTRDRDYKRTIAKGFYHARGSLQLHNARALACNPAPEAYPLTYLNSGQVIGYIVLKLDSYLLNLWTEQYRFRIDQASTALWLSNQGLSIGSAPMPLLSPEGALVDLERAGDSLALENAADKLVVLDLKLQDYAVRKVREQLDELAGKQRSIKVPVQRMGKNAKPLVRK